MPEPDHPRIAHRALVYDDPERYVAVVGAFVRDGVSGDDRVLVSAPGEKQTWLREALGEAARSVEWSDPLTPCGAAFRAAVDFAAGSGRARIVSEQPLEHCSETECRAHMRYEAAVNVAFQPFDAAVLCPFDASRLPDDVLEDALRTHPEVVRNDGPHASTAFVEPAAFIRRGSHVEPPPPGAPRFALEDLGELARARGLVAEHAATAGLGADRIEDLQIAMSEAATNAIRHGAPSCWLWLYEREDMFVCHVRDGGRGLADPLAGYLPPGLEAEGGRGLWITHQVCDVVETAVDDAGSHVFLGVRL